MSDTPKDRVVELEIRLAYQEDTVQALTHTLIEQQKVIDTLTERVEHLRLSLAEVLAPPPRDPSSEVPPHY